MAELEEMGGAPRAPALSRRLYQSGDGTEGTNHGLSQHSPTEGGDFTGGYSESQTQLSQDTEAALAESLAAAEAAAEEAANAWLPPARSSLHFPGEVLSLTSQSDDTGLNAH